MLQCARFGTQRTAGGVRYHFISDKCIAHPEGLLRVSMSTVKVSAMVRVRAGEGSLCLVLMLFWNVILTCELYSGPCHQCCTCC